MSVMKAIRVAVRARRRMRGPQRPSWDENFETWATALHHYSKRSLALPLSVQRQAAHVAVPRPEKSDARFERVQARGVPGEWFHHGGADDSRVLFYLHGGGYSIGSIETHRDVILGLSRASNMTGFAIDYRLAPEHPFPVQLEDALAAYRFLLDRGVDPKRIIIAGDSAGGGLTLSTMIALRDRGEPLPAAAFLISPWVDLEATGSTMEHHEPYDYISRRVLSAYTRRFVSKKDVRNPLAAPLYAELEGLPPLIVHAGGAEALLDDSRRIAERARKAGVSVTFEVGDDMIHAWHLFAGAFEVCRRDVQRAGKLLVDSVERAAVGSGPEAISP
jgi:acetyl esterase/lipase